ncbi:MAG: peptidylprolyl isomerase [Flavobacteriaceae bacterium]|nr:peptidylprolyl isomerase [Flavobacteriaceae bacterium]|tara:strand:- start:1433 stop:2827 length:1395 start_codon:yes stop_codon:yes gene_type:complete
MQLNLRNLKYINNMEKKLLFILFLVFNFSFSQNSVNKLKVDGVSAVIGDYVILDSDIDKTLIDMESQGISTKGISRCQLLGKLMEDKLYAHHAIQDSLEVSVEEVYSMVDRIIDNFINQLGSIEKVLEFYNKEDEPSFRQEIFEINKTQKLSSLMQAEIIQDIEITPEEVRLFFNSIPEIDLPVIGTELEISQIVIEPKVSKNEENRIINLLKSFKEDILENGSSFSSKAILYSQDPGSRSSGGKYTLHRKKPRMVKEFRDVAFRLQEGEISEPFKSDFGWHIILVDKIRGQEVDIRHILLTPKIDPPQLLEAKKIIDTIRTRIINKEISFEKAALAFSTEKETKFNGGVLINPETGDNKFELTKLDPVLYNQIRNLKDGEISYPILDEDRSGLKKYKILLISNRFDEHKADYSLDYSKIKDLALKEKQIKIIQTWMEEKIEETYININKDSRKCVFVNNWLKL